MRRSLRKRRCQGVAQKEDEVSAFLNGRPIGVGRELWQARLLSPGVMGEDRVLAGGAGGTASVGVTGGILVQRHRQLQILLRKPAGKELRQHKLRYEQNSSSSNTE